MTTTYAAFFEMGCSSGRMFPRRRTVTESVGRYFRVDVADTVFVEDLHDTLESRMVLNDMAAGNYVTLDEL